MGLDSRDYARKRRLDFGTTTYARASTTASVRYPVTYSEPAGAGWFFAALGIGVLLLIPLVCTMLLDSGTLPTSAFGAAYAKVFLSAGSREHYVLFIAAAVLFLLLACVLFGYRLQTVLCFAGFGAFGCLASVTLLKVLWAMSAQAHPPVQGHVNLVNDALFAIRIGYTALERPGNEMLGYIAGVGVAEELAKVLPVCVLAIFGVSMRFKLIAAFALGAGFGLAESILYSERFYNGNAPLLTYIMRFVSLVALHAMFTTIACGGLALASKMPGLRTAAAMGQGVEWVGLIAVVGLIPAVVLHGIYDATVTMPSPVYALATIGVTVLFFALTICYGRRSFAD